MNTIINQLPRLYASLVLCLIPFLLSAQTQCTLEECIEMALQNNARIKNAANNLQAANLTKESAFTQYFPSISATGTGFIADKAFVQMDVAPGQNISLLKDGIIGGITAVQPLFAGGQIVQANKLAKIGVETSRLQLHQTEDEIRLTVEQYFWQIVMLKEKLRTLDFLQKQLQHIHQDAEAAVAAGVTNRNDLLQVQLRNNQTRSNYLSVKNTLDISRRLLAQYIGYPADSIEVAMDISKQLPTSPDSLFRSPELSLPSTTAYHLLEKQVDAQRLQHQMAIGKNLPTIAIGGGFLHDNLSDRDRPLWLGNVTVSIPLTQWWSGSCDIKRQRLQLRNAENQMADQSQLLLIQIHNTWNTLNDAYQQVAIAAESISQATENLRLQTDYYQAGTCTMSDLLEAQSLYQQSRDRYVESYAQYEIKKREYLQATGR